MCNVCCATASLTGQRRSSNISIGLYISSFGPSLRTARVFNGAPEVHTSFIGVQSYSTTKCRRAIDDESGFDWYSLTPSENITWTPCYDGQKCARLLLPLDYATPNGPQIAVALQMVPATDLANYKGTILINPGGPGGSGTYFINATGDVVASIAGPDFDLLGFDPRGTGATTPLAQCFDSESEFDVWNLQDVTLLNSSDSSIPYARSREAVTGQRCLQALGGNGSENLNGTVDEWGSGRFMDTASVATDMLHIVEKLGQDKLQYAGLSYGTVLGQYFASMYPDKVGRLMLDGVFDAENYRAIMWSSNLDDTEKVVGSFYTFCNLAGPKCPLYEGTAEKIQSRVDHIINALTPIAVPFASQGPAVITKGILQDLFFSSLYTPLDSFPSLAEVLLAVETNNQTILSQFVDSSVSYKCNCQDPSPWLRQNEASQAIACSDGVAVNDTPAEFEAYLKNLTTKSPIGGSSIARQRLQCAEWKVRAKARYTGPLTANTSFPILLVSPKFDPVCPLDNAMSVHKRFPGSGLLIQNSYGHTASLSLSNCTALAMRAYFVNGTLPKEGTVCQPDVLPFGVPLNSTV